MLNILRIFVTEKASLVYYNRETSGISATKRQYNWKNTMDSFLECTSKIRFDLRRLLSITTDGALAMVVSKNRIRVPFRKTCQRNC